MSKTEPAQKRILGMSTGCFYTHDLSFEETVDTIKTMLIRAAKIRKGERLGIELNSLNVERIASGDYIGVAGLVQDFRHVSIHAPGDVTYPSFEAGKVVETLKGLTSAVGEATSREVPIVIHPDVVDFDYLQGTGLDFVIENMDTAKRTGQDPEFFRKLKDNYSFGFVFDVAHAFDVDPTMTMARELVDVMGDRIRYVHASTLREGQQHDALLNHPKQWAKMLPVIKPLDVPVILEPTFYDGDLQHAYVDVKYANTSLTRDKRRTR